VARLRSLDPGDLSTIGAAIKLHYGAVLLHDRDLRSAYVLLVAAPEVLSRRFGSPPRDWQSWDESEKWDSLFQGHKLSDNAAAAIKALLFNSDRLRLRATFSSYGSQCVQDSFWDQSLEDWQFSYNLPAGHWSGPTCQNAPIRELLPVDRDVLALALKKAYDLRSGAVHAGDDVGLLDVGLRQSVSVSGSRALPFPLLRALVARLVEQELTARGAIAKLPDFSTA
jgi:hypothetical protein